VKTGTCDKETWVLFRHGRYLGGPAALGKKGAGFVRFTQATIGIGGGMPCAIIPTEGVRWVVITSETPSRIGVIGFGRPAGAEAKEHVAGGAHLDSGEVAYFQLGGLTVAEAKAALGPFLREARIPFHGVPAGELLVGQQALAAELRAKLLG
jgi:hypothetical protein